MGYEDLEQYGAAAEASSPSSRSPTRSRLRRRCLEVRRRTVILSLIAVFLVLSVVELRRHEQIKHIIAEHGSAWTASATKGLQRIKGAAAKNATDEQLHDELFDQQDRGPTVADRTLPAQSLRDIHNSTLGVQQIYMLNMPGRTDKSDAMHLMASLSGFSFKVLDAVKATDMSKKAIPNNGVFGEGSRNSGVIGCWRGHMNFAATILENGLSSAMIMEDDIDWDIDLRAQLATAALGAQTLLETPRDSTPQSPYGDGWDMVWLGNCASQTTAKDHRRFITRNDRTVAPFSSRRYWGAVPEMTGYDATTRIMYFAAGGTCTYAYALSHAGAQKVLNTLSLKERPKPIDISLHEMCRDRTLGFKCIGVFPTVFSEHKPAGPTNKDSDISEGDDSNVREHGLSFNIVRSTRMNTDKLIQGDQDSVAGQFGADTVAGPLVNEFRNDDNASEENVWVNQRRRRL